jgi:hypothetical protein
MTITITYGGKSTQATIMDEVTIPGPALGVMRSLRYPTVPWVPVWRP